MRRRITWKSEIKNWNVKYEDKDGKTEISKVQTIINKSFMFIRGIIKNEKEEVWFDFSSHNCKDLHMAMIRCLFDTKLISINQVD